MYRRLYVDCTLTVKLMGRACKRYELPILVALNEMKRDLVKHEQNGLCGQCLSSLFYMNPQIGRIRNHLLCPVWHRYATFAIGAARLKIFAQISLLEIKSAISHEECRRHRSPTPADTASSCT